MSLTPGEAILIRNIVIVVAVFLVWGASILTAYNLAGTKGTIFAFILGPLGVLIATTLPKDEIDERREIDKQARARETKALLTGMSETQATSEPRAGEPVSDSSQSAQPSPVPPPGVSAAEYQAFVRSMSMQELSSALPTADQQTELLRRILFYQSAQVDFLRRITRAAEWFFFWSILGAALVGAGYICGNLY